MTEEWSSDPTVRSGGGWGERQADLVPGKEVLPERAEEMGRRWSREVKELELINFVPEWMWRPGRGERATKDG